ncbi:DUF4145 domain-containing protein [Gluconacetobacter entanii]|uniref:DUF4145 domain-containing protein n=1 Tax=Gluconacetobacter entanii TaxID=108528 RepID=UPI001C933CAB|nr:DUF4145 domain-containing protein [Gluconacetobacter entanii]MBY4641491.1 DUF4145 domain-containing protein [Gluconacetobacter entanii]MCW4581995.1 DUF4145 domain-containing protein [Gluconacetobacter entanii]MCW4585263.1 DUF4145 domain-containing protein [Gluconacetobacter entanii]MCW4588840.1 DUF4145 domain-containing protein [Gluconacetobacter entanii]
MSFFSFRLKCPHCRSESTFRIGSIFSPVDCADDAKVYSVAALCGHVTCYGPVGLRIRPLEPHMVWDAACLYKSGQLRNLGTPQDITPFIEILEQWPPEPQPDIPEFLPPKVAQAFTEAEATRLGGQNLLSAVGYRSALDLATKGINPPPEGKRIEMLGARLGRLCREGLLTPSIGEWAEHIGFAGNASTHDGDALSNAELDELSNLTKMVLIYLITLPEAVKRMRGEHTENGGQMDPETIATRIGRWLSFQPRLNKRTGK